jgi:hypothetical protein
VRETVERLLAWGSRSTARWLLVSAIFAAMTVLTALQIMYVMLPAWWIWIWMTR